MNKSKLRVVYDYPNPKTTGDQFNQLEHIKSVITHEIDELHHGKTLVFRLEPGLNKAWRLVIEYEPK